MIYMVPNNIQDTVMSSF